MQNSQNVGTRDVVRKYEDTFQKTAVIYTLSPFFSVLILVCGM